MRVYQRRWTAADGTARSSWNVAFADPMTGKRVRKTLSAATNKREADAAAALILADVTRRALLGRDAGASLLQRTLTLGEMFRDHVRRAGIADSTRRTERVAAHTSLFAHFGEGWTVADLNGRDIERFRQGRLDAGLSIRSANLPLQVLRAAINRAVADGRLH